jgi:tRNA1Val (adenine37-N6)-methyltransferase
MDSEHLITVELPGYPYLVYQPKSGQTVTQDTQFLLHTVLNRYRKQTLQVLELGSGTGILSILLKLHRPGWHVTGIEIQHQLVDLSIKNAANCNVPIRFIEGDIRKINDFLPLNEYDLVVSNPPFFRIGEFRLSANPEKAISRHELLCTMDDILVAVKKTIKLNGNAFLIYPNDRISEVKGKIKNIDLQIITEFSFSSTDKINMNKTIIVELAYADHR